MTTAPSISKDVMRIEAGLEGASREAMNMATDTNNPTTKVACSRSFRGVIGPDQFFLGEGLTLVQSMAMLLQGEGSMAEEKARLFMGEWKLGQPLHVLNQMRVFDLGAAAIAVERSPTPIPKPEIQVIPPLGNPVNHQPLVVACKRDDLVWVGVDGIAHERQHALTIGPPVDIVPTKNHLILASSQVELGLSVEPGPEQCQKIVPTVDVWNEKKSWLHK